ncbi:MAG: hypothetical protein KBT29_05750 [Prevotellaceae bacterium]|nr:hypothetical protein [Candidatus Minthosoma caballi]
MAEIVNIQPWKARLQNLHDDIVNDDLFELVYDAVANSSLNLDEIFKLEEWISSQYQKLVKEEHSLRRLEPEYNLSYTTEVPGYVDTAAFLLRKLRSGTSTARKIKERLSPRRKPKAMYERRGAPYPSKASLSYLSKRGVRHYAIKLDGMFREEVDTLIGLIVKFYELLSSCLALCLKLIAEENAVRVSVFRSKEQYYKFCKEVENEFANMRTFLNMSEYDAKSDSVFVARMGFDSFEDFVKTMYHKFSTHQLKTYLFGVFMGVCKSLESSNLELKAEEVAADGQKYAGIQSSVFYENDVTESIIAEFDSYIPKLKNGCMPKKVKGKHLSMFALAIGVRPGMADIHAFHEYFLSKYKGTLKICDYTTFNQKLNELDIANRCSDPKALKYVDNDIFKLFVSRKEELESAKKQKIVNMASR